MNVDSDSDDEEIPTVILTPKEILSIGLKMVHFTDARIDRASLKTNTKRFKDHFGCNQLVAAQMFEDLQVSKNAEARLDDDRINANYFLQALHFLYGYETEGKREPKFDLSHKTLRQHAWYYVQKISALKHEKIIFPDDFGENIWVLSLDCIDCPIEEIQGQEVSQDSELFSFKFHGAGLRYEFGIDLFRSNLIWINGCFLPGKYPDNKIFTDFGLKEKLESIGKKALADRIYNGYPQVCSTFNAVDRPVVSKFKARAQMRHEQFNGMVKEFKCMSEKFRHKPDKPAKHQMCMEAVCVICQYRMELGEPLFDILAGL